MIQKYRTRIYTNNIRFGAAVPLTARQKVLVGIGTLTALALASFLAAVPAFAQAAPAFAQNVNEFELFVDCKPVRLVVEETYAERGEDVVTGEAIRNAAEARLRSARMYDPQGPGILYINFSKLLVNVIFSVEFYKRVVDEYGNDGLVRTWRVGGIWLRSKEVGDVVSSVSRYMDEFIVKYFRANDFAC